MLNKRLAAATLSATVALTTSLVMHYEGVRYEAYLDPIGIPTICYGHTAGVVMGQVKTAAECLELLRLDVTAAIKSVDALAKDELPVERRSALSSFTLNVGASKFGRSTLLKELNKGEVAASCAWLDEWVRADGKVYPGLVIRRAEERVLCEVGL